MSKKESVNKESREAEIVDVGEGELFVEEPFVDVRLDLIKEYITKDDRERSELTKREVYALAQLNAIAEELDWTFTKDVIHQYLHMMRSHNRQGIGEDIELLKGMAPPPMSPLGVQMTPATAVVASPEEEKKKWLHR